MLDSVNSDSLGRFSLRLTVGGLMLFHGIDKLLHPASVAFIGQKLAASGLPAWFSYAVYVGEVVAPLMLLLGIFSRLAGLLVALNMVVAIGLMHSGHIFGLSRHGGWAIELQMFYLLGGVTIMLLGSGRLALKPD